MELLSHITSLLTSWTEHRTRQESVDAERELSTEHWALRDLRLHNTNALFTSQRIEIEANFSSHNN